MLEDVLAVLEDTAPTRLADAHSIALRRRASATDPDFENSLLREFAATRSPHLRDRLVERFAPLAHALAARYVHSGNEREDLSQVAMVGLIQALDRYQPERGRFKSFAVTTILGELRHHLRDHSTSIRLPRRTQEIVARITATTIELERELGRDPTVNEIASHCEISLEEALDGLAAKHARQQLSLDVSIGDGDSAAPWVEALGSVDLAYERIETTSAAMSADLTHTELKVLAYYFGRHMKQSEIASVLGTSQMQVSRIIRSALMRMLAQVQRPSPN